MSVKRYLVNLAYIGTPFRGAQRQVKGGNPRPPDPTTIQGVVEMGLKLISPVNDTIVRMASRTDAGVHAFNAACHFDLYRPENYEILEPRTITFGLNKFFTKNEYPIRSLNTRIVDNTFHCTASALSRTYMYRIIIGMHNEEKLATIQHFFPIEEINRAYLMCSNTFDIEMVRKAARMLEGYHDFRTFMGKVQDFNQSTRKEIYSIEVIEKQKQDVGLSSRFSWPTIAMNNSSPETHRIIEIYFKGSGFLYKQIRRTAGALLAVGIGKLSLRELRFMLEVPSKHSWPSYLKSLPGHGLYLCNIEY